MSIVLVSRGSFTHGARVAEGIARRLGYRSVSRELLLEASTEFNVPEARLLHAVNDPLSVVDRILHSRDRYLAYIRCMLLRELSTDDVVYHGFAGHFLVSDVEHVLKVRVEADLEARVPLLMERDHVSAAEAHERLRRIDRDRRDWSLGLYGVDSRDPALFDLTVHLGRLTPSDAIDLVCAAVARPQFHTTARSRQHLADLALAAEVRVALLDVGPDVTVRAEGGVVTISAFDTVVSYPPAARHLASLARTVPGVEDVRLEPHPT